MKILTVLCLLGELYSASAALRPLPPADPNAHSVPIKSGTFAQLIDHQDASKGTFSQRYFYSSEFWKGPGSPMVLFTPGESAADGYQTYATTQFITGEFARAIGGGVVVLEHRYWGESSPFQTLTVENLKYLTLENNIMDLVNFAKTVNLPFDSNHSSNAGNAPWVVSGASYSGALAAWTASVAPSVFWAHHASSAPVEAIYDYWEYFVPIQEGMPQNCSKDISLVIDYVDSVFTKGNPAEQAKLKRILGLESLQHPGDVGYALSTGPGKWQDNDLSSPSGFWQFCDSIENADESNNTVPDAQGVGLEKALAGYGRWMKSQNKQGCAGGSCYNTYDPTSSMYTDLGVKDGERQWQWMLCNSPFGWWQTGAPAGRPTLVSRFLDADWYQRRCALYFPNGYDAQNRSEAFVNSYTRGWDFTNSERLIWVNGQYDPWRETGVSSDFRSNGPLQSTPSAPVKIVPGGFHGSDCVTANGRGDPTVKKVIDSIVEQVRDWVSQYPGFNKNKRAVSFRA